MFRVAAMARIRPVSDRLNAQVADLILEPSDVRERLSWLVFRNGGVHDTRRSRSSP